MSGRIAAWTGTRNIYGDMYTSLKSFLFRRAIDHAWLLIEDDEFPYELPACVSVRNVSRQAYFPPDGPNMSSHFTYMAMIRAALCHEFPELDTILALDCDVVALAGAAGIWSTEIGDNYYAAAQELHRHPGYKNIGVTLYNLAKLRDGKADEVIRALNTRYYRFVEQDAMNELCAGHIAELDGNYNACDYTEHKSVPKILHFAGRKDFRGHLEWVDAARIPLEACV